MPTSKPAPSGYHIACQARATKSVFMNVAPSD